MRERRAKRVFGVLILLTMGLGIANAQRITETLDLTDLNQAEGKIAGVIRRFTSDRGSLNRFYTAPYSSVKRGRFKQFYNESLKSLRSIDFESLNQEEKVDYVLFKMQIDYELRQLELEEKRFAEMESLLPFATSLIGLEDSRRLLQPLDQPKTAALLNSLNKQIQETKRTVEAGVKAGSFKVKKTVANRASDAVLTLRGMFKNWSTYYNGYDPNFTWWVGEPYRIIDASLQDYGTYLREKVVGVKSDDNTTIIGDPIGREALMVELASELIPYTPEELIALAKKEMEWCENELVRASRDMGFGDDWHKALEHVKNLYVEPGKQPELIRKLALEGIDFVEKNNLVTVPTLAKESWRMEMMTPERQKEAPFFLGGEVIQVSYPTDTMAQEDKLMSMRGNNIHFARATVHHELIPGHHLQGFMTDRYNAHRRAFATPFWGEGWALYWEMLLWDLNFPKSPENRVGMLFWRMHRCARIIFSLSYHLGKMTPEECIDFLVDRVGHERANATAEVRRSFRGAYAPLYQLAYMMGALQFRALEKELVKSGKMSYRDFHDAVLQGGRMSVEMVRAMLVKEPLTRDFTTRWKFAGDLPAAQM